MNYKTINTIKNNKYIYNYLRENSSWYKNLNRNPESILNLEEEMKTKYKLTTKDKIESVSQKLEMLNQFMEILK